MRDSLHCPYILISLSDSKNWVQKCHGTQASIWHSHSSGIVSQSFSLSPLFLFSTWAPVFCPLWCPRRTWLQDKVSYRNPQIPFRGSWSCTPLLMYGKSTDYRLEVKLASSFKGDQGNDNIFLAFHVGFCPSWSRSGQLRSSIFSDITERCTNDRNIYTAEKQYTVFLFYQQIRIIFYFPYPE